MNENRGPWYLLTGLVIGLVIGVVYTWTVRPLQYTDTTPATLRKDYKDKYRALIASAFVANGDLVRAKARLELLKDDDVYHVLAEQAQRTLADGSSPDEARALGILAVAIGQETGSVDIPGPVIEATRPAATQTPLPVLTPASTP